jgi:hypothetical protein
MIDFSKGQIALRQATMTELRDHVAKALPSHVEVTIKDSKPPQIRIQDGLWRGISLFIDNSAQQPQLAGYLFRIPTFLAKVIIFAMSVGIFSIILMVVVSVVVGEFVPMMGGIGGIAGFAMYSIVERVIIANMKSSWSPELLQAIEKLKA